MKKVLSIVLCCAMLVMVFAGCGDKAATTPDTTVPDTTAPDTTADPAAPDTTAPAATGDKVIKIGVFEPASGDNGAGGKQEMLGMQYANQTTPTVEVGGETYAVELVYADNQSANDKAVSAAARLVNEGVSVVLGSYGSGVSMAASDTFGDAGVPAIGVTCTNPGVTEGNDHYFRICFLDPFQGTVLAKYAKDHFSATKTYVLAKQGDDYSVGLSNYYMEAFGKENCVYETFPDGTSDFSTYVTNAKAQDCDVFFSPVSTEAAALIIDQAATQGLEIPLLAGDTWDSNVILNAAKGKDVKVNITTFYQEGGAVEFDAGIKAWINENSQAKADNGGDDKVSALSVMGYDAYYVALAAITKADSADPEAIMTALWDVEYDGVSGKIVFDEIGDAVRNVAYIKECNTETGEWDFVAQQSV